MDKYYFIVTEDEEADISKFNFSELWNEGRNNRKIGGAFVCESGLLEFEKFVSENKSKIISRMEIPRLLFETVMNINGKLEEYAEYKTKRKYKLHKLINPKNNNEYFIITKNKEDENVLQKKIIISSYIYKGYEEVSDLVIEMYDKLGG